MCGLDNSGQTGGIADADIGTPEAWDLAMGSRSWWGSSTRHGYGFGDLAANRA
jgi:hypothetical protein